MQIVRTYPVLAERYLVHHGLDVFVDVSIEQGVESTATPAEPSRGCAVAGRV